MAKKKIVYVPQGWTVPYTTLNGKDISMRIYSNAEYEFTMNDGSKCYCTVANVVENLLDGNKTLLVYPKVILTPGFYNPIREASKEDVFKIDDVVGINRVTAEYVRESRSIRNIDHRLGNEVYTFAFDNTRYVDSKYTISILDSEFVVLNIRDAKNSQEHYTSIRKMFGHILSVQDDQIIFERYLSTNGYRSIRVQKYNITDLLGIYRYTLDIISEAEAKARAKERADARAAKLNEKAERDRLIHFLTEENMGDPTTPESTDEVCPADMMPVEQASEEVVPANMLASVPKTTQDAFNSANLTV